MLTYVWVGIYLLSLAVGLRASERTRVFLALWVAVIVLPHVSLGGLIKAWAFQRLVLLAWPAALLILWRAFGTRLPVAAAALALTALAALGGWLTVRSVPDAVAMQNETQPFLVQAIRRLDSDQPHWVYFGETRARATR